MSNHINDNIYIIYTHVYTCIYILYMQWSNSWVMLAHIQTLAERFQEHAHVLMFDLQVIRAGRSGKVVMCAQ